MHARELVELRMRLHDMVQKGQAPALSAQGAFTYAGEMGILVELHAVEHGHHANVLHVAVLHDGIKNNLPMRIHVLQFMPSDCLQEAGYGENGPGAKPPTHVIAADMVKHGVVGYLEDVVLQILEGVDAGNLLMRLGVAEDKVTEAHVLLHQLAQVHAQLLGVLVHEAESFRLRLLAVLALGAFQYQRQVFIPLPDGMQEPQAGVGHFLSAHGKTGIADDTKRIVSEPLIKRHRLLVVTGQHHLGSAPHAQSRRVAIECLLREILALGQDVTIQVWQYAAIETYGVFHQQYHLHASLLDIVLQVHLVLYQLDDGKNKVGIAQPAEHVVENREVFVLHALGDAMGKRGEHHARDVRELLLDIPGHVESVVVRRARHANHQVHLHGTQRLGRLLYS